MLQEPFTLVACSKIARYTDLLAILLKYLSQV